MKKKFFFAAVVLVMSAATAVGYKAYDKGNMSEFMMANIEALTQNETSAGFLATCYESEIKECTYQCIFCGRLWGNNESPHGILSSVTGTCVCGHSL